MREIDTSRASTRIRVHSRSSYPVRRDSNGIESDPRSNTVAFETIRRPSSRKFRIRRLQRVDVHAVQMCRVKLFDSAMTTLSPVALAEPSCRSMRLFTLRRKFEFQKSFNSRLFLCKGADRATVRRRWETANSILALFPSHFFLFLSFFFTGGMGFALRSFGSFLNGCCFERFRVHADVSSSLLLIFLNSS